MRCVDCQTVVLTRKPSLVDLQVLVTGSLHLVGDVLKLIRRWRLLEDTLVGIVLKILNHSSALILVHILKQTRYTIQSNTRGQHNYIFCASNIVYHYYHLHNYCIGIWNSSMYLVLSSESINLNLEILDQCFDILFWSNYWCPGDHQKSYCWVFFFGPEWGTMSLRL